MTTRSPRRRLSHRNAVHLSTHPKTLVFERLNELPRSKRKAGEPGSVQVTRILASRRRYGGAAARNLEAFTHFPFLGSKDGPGIPQSAVDGWFSGLEDGAGESGNPMPSPEVIEEAKRIINALLYQLPTDTDIYTLEDGKIEVEVSGSTGYGLSLICEPGGSALCLIAAKNASRRARYNNSSAVLPDGFLLEGLAAVRRSREVETSFEASLH